MSTTTKSKLLAALKRIHRQIFVQEEHKTLQPDDQQVQAQAKINQLRASGHDRQAALVQLMLDLHPKKSKT